MRTVKELLVELSHNKELSARLTLFDEVFVKRFQYQTTNESDWAVIGNERLLKSRRLAVVANTHDGRLVYDALRAAFPERVAIDIIASAGLAEDLGSAMPTKLLFEYLSVAKKPAIFRTPLSKDYGSVAGPNEVFTIVCITTLGRMAELAIADGQDLNDQDLLALFFNRVDTYVEYCQTVFKLMDNRYGKFYVCVYLDGRAAESYPVLRPEVAVDALLDSVNLEGALTDAGYIEPESESREEEGL